MMSEELEKAFERWFQDKYGEAVQWRDWQSCENLLTAKTWLSDGFQAAYSLQQEKIDKLNEVVRKLMGCAEFYAFKKEFKGGSPDELKRFNNGKRARQTLKQVEEMKKEMGGRG